MLRRTIIAAVLAVGTGALADTPAQRQLAEDLLVEMKVDRMLQQARQQGMEAQKKLFADTAGTPGGEERVRKTLARMNDILDRELGWEGNRKEFAELYTGTFTEEELKDILAFYRSSTGKKFVGKYGDLLRASSEVIRRKMVAVVPELQKIAREGKEAAEKPRIPVVAEPRKPLSLLPGN